MATNTEFHFDPKSIKRPVESLARYYGLVSLLSGPFFPFAFVPLYLKYMTLRYQFDESGVSMSWGILFKREIHLTYRRIQDIHLTQNILQRWMGLATVAIQTASGSAGPEMSIEGVLQADALRDYLYRQMRGARGEKEATSHEPAQDASADEPLVLLREIRDLLKARSLSEGRPS
ncbi:MAG: PH domain-containing protein [Planctomycetota bacterium]|nr:PH domain-containing protein [Planctomycetota bacterium]